jgi:hypothetical protein
MAMSDAALLKVLAPEAYVARFVDDGTRPDGRSFAELRHTSVSLGAQPASARAPARAHARPPPRVRPVRAFAQESLRARTALPSYAVAPQL